MTRGVRHVNLPYVHPVAQQSVNQLASQPITTSGVVLFQQASSQITQYAPRMASAYQPTAHGPTQMASANQPTAPAPTQIASAAQPMAQASPQSVEVPSQQTPVANQQVNWSAKIAEVIKEQFGLRPKQQSVMCRTPYLPAYDQLPFPHKYKVPDFTKFSGQ